MQDSELTAWLGPVVLDDEQMATLRREVQWAEDQWPDDAGLRDEAMSAVVQHMLGDATVEQVKARLGRANAEVAAARAAMRATARLLVAGGMSEVAAADALGVQRLTVRGALGKR